MIVRLSVGRLNSAPFENFVAPVDARIADNFGYVLNGYYTMYQLDGTAAYRDAVAQQYRLPVSAQVSGNGTVRRPVRRTGPVLCWVRAPWRCPAPG